MKVSVKQIDSSQEELAQLLVHEYSEHIENLVQYIESDNYRSRSILCSLDGDFFPVQTNHIIFIEAAPREKLMVHTNSNIYEVRKRLYELASILPPNFIRISKSVIINMDKVTFYKPTFSGLMQIQFQNGATAYISRKYLKEVRNQIMEVQNGK